MSYTGEPHVPLMTVHGHEDGAVNVVPASSIYLLGMAQRGRAGTHIGPCGMRF